MDKLRQLSKLPTDLNNVHESVFRSYQLLELVKAMLKRGDSVETILLLIAAVEDSDWPIE